MSRQTQLQTGSMLGHYRIVRQLGEGGMGAVYLAEDTLLGRRVAVKIPPGGIADDPDRLARFRREARSAAALNHPGIVTIHSVEESDGLHFITMEHLEGTTLEDLIPEGGFEIDRAADLALRLVEAVAAAHSAGLVHRDLKPSNAMIVGQDRLKVIDFGLARISMAAPATGNTAASTDFLTEEGVVSGTLPYMAPEQLLGRPVDSGTDVWALGAVVYEMVAGSRPFVADTSPGLVNAIINHDPPPLESIQSGLPAGFAEVVEKALSKDPSERYASAVEMADALRTVVGAVSAGDRPEMPGARQPWTRRAALSVAILVVISGVAVWSWMRTTRRERVRSEAVPELVRLIEADDYASAVALAHEIERDLPGDPVLAELWPKMSRRVELRSRPEGASVSARPYAGSEEDWRNAGVTPVDVRLPIGFHRFRFELEGHVQVERAIKLAPLSDARRESAPDAAVELAVDLPEVGAIPPEMVEVPAGTMSVEITGLEFLEWVDTNGYLLDRYEVSNHDYAEFVAAGGYDDPTYWEDAIALSGSPGGWTEMVSTFVDATGRPGPATWEVGSFAEGAERLPVSGISWFEAAAYCAFRGKQLPTLFHWSTAAEPYYFAAEVMPFSRLGGEAPGEVGSSLAMTGSGVYDMAGNVKEWCSNGTGSGENYILGGAWPEAAYMFLDPDAKDPFDRSTVNGVRCLMVPGGLPADHPSRRDVQFHRRDYAKEQPVSGEVFAVYAGLYAGDDAPLRADVESVDESSQYWTREVVTFDTGYDDGRMILHLMLPRTGTPPYRTVVFFPGSGAIMRADSSQINPSPFDYLVRQGWAVAYPIVEGTYERRTTHQTDFPNDSSSFREWNLHMAQDIRRTVDYLGTRNDLDTSSLGYLGYSWGGERGSIMLAVEDRFKVAVFISGGLTTGRSLPEADPFNFAPRVEVPVLMLNGFHDYFFPVETGQNPLFENLGTAPDRKRHIVYQDDGHSLHASSRRNQVISEILAWFEKYQPRPGSESSSGAS